MSKKAKKTATLGVPKLAPVLSLVQEETSDAEEPPEPIPTESESVAMPRLIATGQMPWMMPAGPWVSGLTQKRLHTWGKRHQQATGHEVEYTARGGAECRVCEFKAFGKV